MGIIKINTRFDVKSARIVCEQKVSVRPIAHHYEEIGQPEYIKWSCPICEEIAKKYPNFILDEDCQFNNFSFTEETERCPVCGINLNWDAPNFAYEHKKRGKGYGCGNQKGFTDDTNRTYKNCRRS